MVTAIVITLSSYTGNGFTTTPLNSPGGITLQHVTCESCYVRHQLLNLYRMLPHTENFCDMSTVSKTLIKMFFNMSAFRCNN